MTPGRFVERAHAGNLGRFVSADSAETNTRLSGGGKLRIKV